MLFLAFVMLNDHGISGHAFLISGHVFLISGHVGPRLVLGRILMVVCGLQKATFGSFRGWCGAAFLSGFGAGSDGGLPLRKRRPGMHLEASLLVVALAV